MSCALGVIQSPACVPDKPQTADCSICLESCPQDTTAKSCSGCKQFFHRDCIHKWLHSHTTCPLCRISLRECSQFYFVEMRSDGMIYHWEPSHQDQASHITWGMPPLGATIQPGRTWWDSSVDGEMLSDTVVWEIFQSIITLLAVDEWVSLSDTGPTAIAHVS